MKVQVIGCILVLLANVLFVQAQKTEIPSIQGRRVLVVWGGWEGHKPEEFAKRVSSWLQKEGANVQVHNTKKVYADSVLMDSIDLIIQYCTMDKIEKEEEKGLLRAVQRGVGLAGCHGGLCDSYRQNVAYQYMTGGQWVSHPGGEIDYSVQITDRKDAVSEGVSDFDIHTEQYYMHVDPNVKVLATTTFSGATDSWIEGAVMPVAWKKYHGNGRVFYLSIGHSPSTFDVPQVWDLLTRGIKWASASKYQPKESWMSPVYPNGTGKRKKAKKQ